MHVIDVRKDILEINRRIAERNRELFEENGIFAFDITGAIGSGKTSLIEILVNKIHDLKIAAIAGDVISDLDSRRIEKLGIPTLGINTGKECHLDAHLIKHSLVRLPLEDIDILFIENVGNLICPVDFPLGTQKRITVVSVSEGDDTVEKHPMIFMSSDAVIINKVDIAEAVGADPGKMKNDALKINPGIRVFPTSIKDVAGISDLVSWIRDVVKNEQ